MKTTKISRIEALLQTVGSTIWTSLFHPRGSRGAPGKVIEHMNEETRAQLRELKSDDIQKPHDYLIGLVHPSNLDAEDLKKEHDERCMKERKVMRPSDGWGKKGIL